MRVGRGRIDCTDYSQIEWMEPAPGAVTTASEMRVVLNRFEAKLLHGALAVREWWFETVTYRLGRLLCRYFRRHNVTCRGRRDHTTPSGIVDRGRWHYWPRR